MSGVHAICVQRVIAAVCDWRYNRVLAVANNEFYGTLPAGLTALTGLTYVIMCICLLGVLSLWGYSVTCLENNSLCRCMQSA